MLSDMMADYGGSLLVAIAGVGLALVALVAVLKFLQQRNGAVPFSLGVKTRTQRLQLVDTTAIDARRRLILVRRDDVEHLILVGGPSDVVIESRIGAPEAPVVAYPYAPPAPEPQRQPPLFQSEREHDRYEPASTPASRSLPATEPRQMARPVERSVPLTPNAAYFEADDDFTPPPRAPAPSPSRLEDDAKAAALKAAEEHLEALKRRMNEYEKSSRGKETAPRTASSFGKVLDREMKAPPADALREVPAAIQQIARRDNGVPIEQPPRQKPAAEANIQDEIARIFGDKR